MKRRWDLKLNLDVEQKYSMEMVHWTSCLKMTLATTSYSFLASSPPQELPSSTSLPPAPSLIYASSGPLYYKQSNPSPTPFILLGDFNSVLEPGERSSACNSCPLDIETFSSFISEAGVVDIPLHGKPFTWYGHCSKASRLDRFLPSQDFLQSFSPIAQSCLERSISDLCPILLNYGTKDWGPKPSKFLNSWLSHPDFLPDIQRFWQSYNIQGSPHFVLSSKLRLLHNDLKQWNALVFGNVDSSLLEISSEIESLVSRNTATFTRSLEMEGSVFAKFQNYSFLLLCSSSSLIKPSDFQAWSISPFLLHSL